MSSFVKRCLIILPRDFLTCCSCGLFVALIARSFCSSRYERDLPSVAPFSAGGQLLFSAGGVRRRRCLFGASSEVVGLSRFWFNWSCSESNCFCCCLTKRRSSSISHDLLALTIYTSQSKCRSLFKSQSKYRSLFKSQSKRRSLSPTEPMAWFFHPRGELYLKLLKVPSVYPGGTQHLNCHGSLAARTTWLRRMRPTYFLGSRQKIFLSAM